jgi:uncharacterized coiled-coil protein SlyX
MPAAPLVMPSGTGVASSAPAPLDINSQIQAVFQTRQLILDELTALDDQRKDLARTTVLSYSSDVAAKGVDPAKAVVARDAWQAKDTLFVSQQSALKDLLTLVEARIEEFKRTNKGEVSVVLRDQIAFLSDDLTHQEKAEHLTERQLKVLWNELREVDPGYLATIAKESSLRLPAAKKSVARARKQPAK